MNLLPERGKRKIAIALIALTMTFVLALVGRLSGGEWVTALGLVLALFGAANVVNHVAGEKPEE